MTIVLETPTKPLFSRLPWQLSWQSAALKRPASTVQLRSRLLKLFLVPFVQRASAQHPLLHHDEENRDQDQNVNRGSNHSADNGRGNGFHHVRADSALP